MPGTKATCGACKIPPNQATDRAYLTGMLVGLAGARLRAAAGIKDYDVLGEVMCPEHFELMQSLVVNAAEIAKKAGL